MNTTVVPLGTDGTEETEMIHRQMNKRLPAICLPERYAFKDASSVSTRYGRYFDRLPKYWYSRCELVGGAGRKGR